MLQTFKEELRHCVFSRDVLFTLISLWQPRVHRWDWRTAPLNELHNDFLN